MRALSLLALSAVLVPCAALFCGPHFRMQGGRCERCRYAGRCAVGHFQPVCNGTGTGLPPCLPCTNKPPLNATYTSSAVKSSRCGWECDAGTFPFVKNVSGVHTAVCRGCPDAPSGGYYRPIDGRRALARAHYQAEPDAGARGFQALFGLTHDSNDAQELCKGALACRGATYLNHSVPACMPCGNPECRLDERLEPCRPHSPSRCVKMHAARAVTLHA